MKNYDFAINWSGTIHEYFVNYIQKLCKENRLSFLWISENNISQVLKNLEKSKIRIKILLDTEATYNKKGDLYSRICYYVKDRGGAVINDPDRTKFAIDKSVVHYELINANITVPYTIVVRNWEPNDFRLTDKERNKLKTPFIIKPALGYGQLGVIKEAKGSIGEIAKARHYDKGDNFLLQEKILPVELGGRRAWFRIFNVFDTIIPCWWDDYKNLYEHISYEEFNKYCFLPLAKIVSKIASITRMAWFSTEIAIDKFDDKMRFVAIDYVNDQCDMSSKSETTSGVPDYIVEYTAKNIINSALNLINYKDIKKKYTIFLKEATIDVRGLGTSPSILRQLFPRVVNPKKRTKKRIMGIFK